MADKATQLNSVHIDYRQLEGEAAVDQFFQSMPNTRLVIPGQRSEIDRAAWSDAADLRRRAVLGLISQYQRQLADAREAQAYLERLNAQE